MGPQIIVLYDIRLAHTGKKKKFPHIQYKEIQTGAFAKSYMTNGLLKYD